MATTTEIYKGVKLIEGRTTEMIDFVADNYSNMNAVEMASALGFETYHKIVPIMKGIAANTNLKSSTQLKKEAAKEAKKAAKEAKKQAKEEAKKQAKELKPVIEGNSFTNYKGENKSVTRDIICKCICNTSTVGSNILTLPADAWIMEKLIIFKNPSYKFTAVERQKETYMAMVKNMVADKELLSSVISTHNSTIGEVIETAKADTYSSALLDYCGFIDTVYDEVKDVLTRKLVRKNGYITITVAQANRTMHSRLHADNYTNRYVESCNNNTNSIEATDFLIKNMIFNMNGDYKLEHKLMYKDSCGMLLYVIRRVA